MNSVPRCLTVVAVSICLWPCAAHAQAPAVSAQGSDAPAPTETPEEPGTPATAEKPKKRRFQLGPEFGVFRLSNARSRNRFGDTEFSIGLGFTPIRQATTKGDFGFDFKLFYLKENNNRAIWAPIGVDYRKAFPSTEDAKFRPYIGASLNAVPANIKAPLDGVDTKLKFGLGGSAFAGLLFSDKVYVEARYIGITKISTFDLSGAALTAGIRF